MTSPLITERSVIGTFYERLKTNAASSIVDAISTAPMLSDQDSETYAWMGMVPSMVAKQGEKKFSQLRDVAWTVKNVEYQGGIVIPKKHIMYDKTDQVMIRVNELADRTNDHWWSLVAPLIINAETTPCYDGQYFFDTDHSEADSGAQDNDITYNVTTPTDPTAAEMISAIMSGVTTMMGFKDDRGEYLNEGVNEFLILVGTPLLTNAMKALSQTQISSGDSNILIEQDSFKFRVQASPRLSAWTDRFAIFSTQGTQRPIIRQQRKPNNAAPGYNVEGMLMETLWTDSEYCKINDNCLVSIETERAVAYGDWKKACLVTLT